MYHVSASAVNSQTIFCDITGSQNHNFNFQDSLSFFEMKQIKITF